ncbi:MAG: undecaprenyl-diphosphate phosphatase [Planctomycetota bacterium]|jgi:undecaprenyl-diphosphatase
MSDYVIALIAGIVEGLTEFLPVSSTAHIVITQKLLGIELSSPFWKMFTVVIQLGAILSVVVFFHKRIVGFFQSFWAAFRGLHPVDEKDANTDSIPVAHPSKHWLTHPLSLVLISFVVTAIPCFLMDKWIGENLESPTVIGIALIVGGIVMVLIDLLFSKGAQTERMEDMTLSQAIVIGSAQILAATFPGTSRSMSTIAGGQVMGLTRTTALEFSFFLSIPVMFAASGFKLIQFLVKEPIALSSSQWLTLAIGFTTSFFVALIVIAWFMGWVRKHGFIPFAIYRVVVGMAVLAWLR